MRRIALATFVLALAACGGQPAKPPAFFRRDAVTQKCADGTTVKGIDVSAYQGSYANTHVNWDQVATTSVKFAIARISDGTGTLDADFSYNWTNMKRVGLVRGAYQFYEPSESATAQANIVVNAVGMLGPGDLPVTLDIETGSPTATELNTWLSAVETGTGKKPMVYTAYGLWNGWFPNGGFEAYPLWVANYGVTCPGMPNKWTAWKFWQYSDDVTVAGITTGGVDGDEWNGDLASLQTFAGGGNDCGGAADGTYCGGHGVTGDADTLYRCASNVKTQVEPCAGWCAHNPTGDFCAQHHRTAFGPDLDGDGKADLCARGSAGMSCWTSAPAPFATSVTGPALTDASGWAADAYASSIQFADVNHDGKADLCARSSAGVKCWLSNGSGFPTATSQDKCADGDGWSKPEYRRTIQFADVDGDGKADLCARRAAGFSCWLSTGTGFTTRVDAPDMSDAQGWDQVQYYATIQLADVNGDGKADLCGRGYLGFECWLSNGTAFTGPETAVDAFSDPNGGDALSVFPTIELGDIDGDGKLDVCGRTTAGYTCFKGDGTGKFPTQVTGPALSDANGWGAPQYGSTIQLADVNGDGRADVCGRGVAGVFCWLSGGSGFPTQVTGPTISDSSGWSGPSYDTTVTFADVDGDGRADVCGRASAGYACWLSDGSGFPTHVPTTLLANADGYNQPQYVQSVSLVGQAVGLTAQPTTGGSGSGSTTTTTTAASTGTSGFPTTAGDGSDSTGSSSAAGTTSGSGSSGATTASTGSTGGDSGSTAAGSTDGATAGGSAGAGTSGSTGGEAAKKGGCGSVDGMSLFALFCSAGLISRRRHAK